MTKLLTYKRSPFFYVGDKFKLLSQLKEKFPQNIDRFIEPFCGGGSVFLNIVANQYMINDINYYLIKLHQFLINSSYQREFFWQDVKSIIDKYQLSATYWGKDVPREYRENYIKTYFAKYNKIAYIKMRNDFNLNKQDMLLLYLLLIYGFNRMLRFNSRGNFNLPVGNVDFNKNVYSALNSYFDFVSSNNIKIFNMDFQKFIEKVNPNPDDFVYLDPPYLITESEYNKIWNYNCEIRLINFLDELNSKKVRFAISNIVRHKLRYNNIFDKWAQKYNITQIRSNYISYHDNSEKNSYEVLVTNY